MTLILIQYIYIVIVCEIDQDFATVYIVGSYIIGDLSPTKAIKHRLA